MNFKRAIAALALGTLTSIGAQAAIIDFDAHPTDFGTPIYDSGFRFDFGAAGWGVFGPGSGACCDVNYNGTTAMFANGDNGGTAQIVMTVDGGGTFSVSSLDAAVYWIGAPAGSIELIGAINGGGTVSTTLATGGAWMHHALSGFDNLDSLTFRDTTSGAFLQAPGFGIDNINTAPVPEPESYALMIAGLAALGLVRRYRKQ